MNLNNATNRNETMAITDYLFLTLGVVSWLTFLVILAAVCLSGWIED